VADNINVVPAGSGGVPVGTRTLTVQSAPGVQVPYNIPGFESTGTLVPVDATHGLPVAPIDPDTIDTITIGGVTYTIYRGFVNVTASGETTLVTGVGGKKIRLIAWVIGPVSAPVNVFFDTAADGAISSTKYLAANYAAYSSGYVQTVTAGAALRINLSATANAGVDFLYVLV